MTILEKTDAQTTVRRIRPGPVAGWVLSGLFTAFMVLDVGVKLMNAPIVDETLTALGWPTGVGVYIGLLEALLVALYLFRPTAVLGAILLTALMGGAVATHLRLGNPLFSHVLFGVYLALFVWGGLWLRDEALRRLMPWRRGEKCGRPENSQPLT